MSRKRKYSDEFRLKVVSDYLSGQSGGFETIADKYRINHSMVERWVHIYELHGAEGLCESSGAYSGEFKVHVVEYMHKERLSLTETANQFCIQNHNTVAKWERIYYEEGPDALLEERRGRKNMGKKKSSKPKKNVNENEDLLAEVQRLRMENEYLKKLNALVLEREKSEQKKK
jgi:transposase